MTREGGCCGGGGFEAGGGGGEMEGREQRTDIFTNYI